jgi:hypothetical protein
MKAKATSFSPQNKSTKHGMTSCCISGSQTHNPGQENYGNSFLGSQREYWFISCPETN